MFGDTMCSFEHYSVSTRSIGLFHTQNMGRLVDAFRLTRFPPDITSGGVRFTFSIVQERPWWSFQVVKHTVPLTVVKLCSNSRGRSALEADLFERGFLADGDAKAKQVAWWLVRHGYAVAGRVSV